MVARRLYGAFGRKADLLQAAVFDFFELLVERAAADSQEFAGLAFVASTLSEDGFDVA